MPRGRPPVPYEIRFWKKVPAPVGDACCVYLGHKDARLGHGYGVFTLPDGTRIQAHRLAYKLRHDDFDPKLMVLHTCDNPPCCRDDHTFQGTQFDNMSDCAAKDRMSKHVGKAGNEKLRQHPELRPRGAKFKHAVLNDDKVREIRRLRTLGLSQQAIADTVGYNQAGVSRILLGKSWAHVA